MTSRFDQLINLIEIAEEIPEEKKTEFIRALETDIFTEAMREELRVFFENEVGLLDGEIGESKTKRDSQVPIAESKREKVLMGEEEIVELHAGEMDQIVIEFEGNMAKSEKDLNKDIEGDARGSDAAKADAIRAELLHGNGATQN